MRKVFIFLIIICALFETRGLAQTNEARKVDEFNQGYYPGAREQILNLALKLSEEPGATAYIIVYTSDKDYPGSGYRFANRLRNYFLTLMNDEKRVAAIAGGRREKPITELWIVPNGAKPPVPTSVFSPEQIPADRLIKFDSYTIKLSNKWEWDAWDGIYEDEPTRLTGVAEVLKKRSDLRLIIVARSEGVYVCKPVGKKLPNGTRKYTEVRSDKLSDPIGLDRKLANSDKTYLIKKLGIKASRVTAVGNGYSLISESEPEILSPADAKLRHLIAERTIELWLVPANESDSAVKKILEQ